MNTSTNINTNISINAVTARMGGRHIAGLTDRALERAMHAFRLVMESGAHLLPTGWAWRSGQRGGFLGCPDGSTRYYNIVTPVSIHAIARLACCESLRLDGVQGPRFQLMELIDRAYHSR